MIRIRSLCLFTLILVLTACGSGGGASGAGPANPGGGGSGGGGGGGGGGGTGIPGSRAVPGYNLAVTTDHPAVAGATCVVTLLVTPDAGMAAPQAVAAGVGDATGFPALTAGQPVPGTTDQWSWLITLPTTLVGQRLMVQIQDPQGNISTSGFEDFVLVP